MISGELYSLSSDLYNASTSFKNEVLSPNTGNIVSADSVQTVAPSQSKVDEELPIESPPSDTADPSESGPLIDGSRDSARQAALAYSQNQLKNDNLDTFTEAATGSDSEDEANEEADDIFDNIQTSHRNDAISNLFSADSQIELTGRNLSIIV